MAVDFSEMIYVTHKHILLVSGYINELQPEYDKFTIPDDVVMMIILISNKLEEFYLGTNPHSRQCLKLSKDNYVATIARKHAGWISAFGKLRIEHHSSLRKESYEWTFNVKAQMASIGINIGNLSVIYQG